MIKIDEIKKKKADRKQLEVEAIAKGQSHHVFSVHIQTGKVGHCSRG